MVTLLKTSVQAPWHSWPDYQPFVAPLFGEVAVIEAQEWDGTVEGPVISLADEWDRPLPDTMAQGLLRAVERGGRLMVLHHGISLQAHPGLEVLIGGRFIGHPPAGELTFRIPGSNETWTMTDEPYQFQLASNLTPLLEYWYEGSWRCAGWHHRVGNGQVAYLMPGHFPENFQHPRYQTLIRECWNRLISSP